jgi:hypothetical protein
MTEDLGRMLQSLANGRNRSRSPGTRWEADDVAMAILDSTGTVRWEKEGCGIHDRMVHDVIIIVQEGRSILSAQPYPIKECPAAIHIPQCK